MTTRRARVHKVIAYREQRMNERTRTLAQIQEARSRTAAELAARRLEAEEAEKAARQLANGTRLVDDWLLLQDWMKACRAAEDVAVRRLRAADEEVERAKQEILKARSELKRVELWAQKLEASEKVGEERAERRQFDEFAARRFDAAKRQKERG